MLDITERKAAEERIAFLAYHDKLTGLPNRTMFDELLGLALARAKRHGLGVVVVTVDIDDFKLVNDSLGHEAGDAILVQFAQRLSDATRETDLVARPGGDEFLLLLADLDPAPASHGGDESVSVAAESVALRIQEELRTPFIVGDTELYVTASLGISAFPDDAVDAPTLLKNAETAMFRSKRSGPGGYVLHAKDDADSIVRLSMSTRLRRAVEQEQWMLHYQPLIDLRTAEMTGVEALIRWPEPNGGLVPPGDFIPLAEEMGLIEAIGAWVIDEVCRQGRIWREQGLDIDMSFNLSPRQLWQDDIVDRIVGPILGSGMDPSRVTVEITESTAMTNPDRTLGILHELHARGLRLAIDDFGTGYSSLARLRYMPVHILKIDRSFVRELDRDEQNASMVSAMVALASNLGMIPLAEGIETEDGMARAHGTGMRAGAGLLLLPAGPGGGDPRDPSARRAPHRGRRRRPVDPGSAPAARPEPAPLAPRPAAEHDARRRHLHPLLLELRMEVEPRRHPADVAELLRRHERDARPRPARPRRPSHPVDVALVVLRRVVVHDQRDPFEVEPARGHVRRDQDPDVTRRRTGSALAPAPAGSDRRASRRPVTPFGPELPREVVDGPLRVHEHEGRAGRLRGEPGEGRELVLRRHRDEPVVRLLHEAHLDGTDLVAHRVARVHLGDPADRAVERGGEEHRLTVLRQMAHDPVHLGLEPHVEHPVRLVEHEDLHAVEVDHAALHEVVQTPRRGDQDVRRSHALATAPAPSCRRRRP